MPLLVWLGEPNSPEQRHALLEVLLRSGLDPALGIAFAETPEAAHLNYGTQASSKRGLVIPFQGLFPQKNLWLKQTQELLQKIEPTSWQANHPLLFPQGQQPTVDLFGCCYGLLQRWEEDLNPTRDEHNRWPAEESLLTQANLLEIPVVDWISRCLGEELHRRFGLPLRKAPPVLGALSWDVDSAGFWQIPQGLGKIKRALQANPQCLPDLINSAWKTVQNHRVDPDRLFKPLAHRLHELNVRSSVFVQTHKLHPVDDYDLKKSPWLTRQLRDFAGCGHELGLHSSYSTPDNDNNLLQKQQYRLLQAFGVEHAGHRAHYLRHSTPELDVARWESQEYDASLGFSRRIGFRLGTAWPVELLRNGKTVLELPLHAMDVTLRHHQLKGFEQAKTEVLTLIDRVKQTGGVMSLLWHPHNLNPITWSDWKDFPFEVVEKSGIDRWETLAEAKRLFKNERQAFRLPD